MIRGAEISANGLYRYVLTREWQTLTGEARTLTFVMLNPSTADDRADDQTIRRCIGYAERDDCSRLRVVNLYAYRTPSPADLRAARDDGVDIVGPENEHHVEQALMDADRVVVAWGIVDAAALTSPIMRLVRSWHAPLFCVGTTADGSPRHPSRGAYRPLVLWQS